MDEKFEIIYLSKDSLGNVLMISKYVDVAYCYVGVDKNNQYYGLRHYYNNKLNDIYTMSYLDFSQNIKLSEAYLLNCINKFNLNNDVVDYINNNDLWFIGFHKLIEDDSEFDLNELIGESMYLSKQLSK
jgi:hypothetical protein